MRRNGHKLGTYLPIRDDSGHDGQTAVLGFVCGVLIILDSRVWNVAEGRETRTIESSGTAKASIPGIITLFLPNFYVVQIHAPSTLATPFCFLQAKTIKVSLVLYGCRGKLLGLVADCVSDVLVLQRWLEAIRILSLAGQCLLICRNWMVIQENQ